jgi:hypothetical protein
MEKIICLEINNSNPDTHKCKMVNMNPNKVPFEMQKRKKTFISLHGIAKTISPAIFAFDINEIQRSYINGGRLVLIFNPNTTRNTCMIGFYENATIKHYLDKLSSMFIVNPGITDK